MKLSLFKKSCKSVSASTPSSVLRDYAHEVKKVLQPPQSENVAGACEPIVHAHLSFRFKNGQGKRAFFSIHAQNTAETRQPQAQPTVD